MKTPWAVLIALVSLAADEECTDTARNREYGF